jgi:hypothetical protein
MHEYIEEKFKHVITRRGEIIGIMKAQTTIILIRVSEPKTVDEYQKQIAYLKEARPRLQMVVYVVEDGELPADIFFQDAELDAEADSPHVQVEKNAANVTQLKKLTSLRIEPPIMLVCTNESALMTRGFSFPTFSRDLRAVFETLFARSYRLSSPIVLEVIEDENDMILVRLLYYYASVLNMVNIPTYDRFFSCFLSGYNVLSVDGLVATLSSEKRGRERGAAVLKFVRSYLLVKGHPHLRRLSFPISPFLKGDALEQGIAALSISTILEEWPVTSGIDKQIQLFGLMAESFEIVDEDAYWSAIMGRPHPRASEYTPLSPNLVGLLASNKITAPPLIEDEVLKFVSIEGRTDYGFPLLDCDDDLDDIKDEPAPAVPPLWSDLVSTSRPSKMAGTADLPMKIQYPGLMHGGTLKDRFDGLMVFEQFVIPLIPTTLHVPRPLPPMPPFYLLESVFGPLNLSRTDADDRIRVTDHRGPFGGMPPPIIRLRRTSAGDFTLFFVPVARVFSPPARAGLQAGPPFLPAFVKVERIQVIDRTTNTPVDGMIECIPSALMGQQRLRYYAIVAAFKYRASQTRDDIIEYLRPIAAYYRAVRGLIWARSQHSITLVGPEEGRVLFMRSGKSDASAFVLTQRLAAIEKAMAATKEGDEQPLDAPLRRFFSKYENCTAPPPDARAIYQVLGLRNWIDWGAKMCTLFVPTTFAPPPRVDQSAVDAAALSKTETLSRIYFMRKPWPNLLVGSTIMLGFLKYMGVTDYSRFNSVDRVVAVHENLISELSYFFGPTSALPNGGFSIGKDGIRLFFDSPRVEIEAYIGGLASRLPYCKNVYVSPATYLMMIRFPPPAGRSGVPILVGALSSSL